MNKYEQFIQQETKQLLKPDENIEAIGFIYNKSLLGMIMFGVISFIGNGYFFAVATKNQLILIETEMGFSTLKTGETIKFRLNTLARVVPGQKQFIRALQDLYEQAANRTM